MLHSITRSNQINKDAKRVGRGGKRGKTSGRGTKGQSARAGARIRPEIRDAIKRLPKLRGYKFNSIHKKPLAVNLAMIEKHYNAGEVVNPATLYEKGLVSYKELRTLPVKVLSFGTITKKLTFDGLEFSKKAKDAIIAASGIIEE